MGAFFTNVQVRTSNLTSVADAIAGWIGQIGYALTSEVESADRTVLLARNGDWVAVYDEAADTGAAAVGDVGRELSSRLETYAMTVNVHDSDVLVLELFRKGDLVDCYNSAPDYFEKMGDVERAKVAGAVELWRDLLVGGHDESDLAKVFADRRLFCEDNLAAIAAQLGMDAARVGTGYQYIAESGVAETVAVRFRLLERPGYERQVVGPPRLTLPWGADRLPPEYREQHSLMVGSPVQLSALCRNIGGASRGVEVIVEGDGLARGHVKLTKANVVVGIPREREFAETALVERDGCLVAAFPDIAVPPGIDGDVNALMVQHPDKMVDLMHVSNVHVNLHGDALAPGQTTLRVTIVPVAAVDARFTRELELVIEAAAPRPLHAESELYPHQLAPLQGRDTQFLLVSFDASRNEAAAFASVLAREWFGTRKNLQATIFHRDPGAAPSAGIEVPWKRLQETFIHEQLVCVAGASGGFSFGTRVLPSEIEDQPTFAMWMNDPHAPAVSFLSRAAARAMTEARGIQALMTCWSWEPSFSLDTTPYESVCGIHGGCTLQKRWLTRFARGVGAGELWLGPDLTARVDCEALARVAAVAHHDAVLAITIPDDQDAIHAVERALAPILPKSDDYHAF
ncbi:MAG TPA: hypothetical protein VFB62_09980 [Polyangiaceae bacterium]|nr:hypothetical protein [Polyangiaceae bacterium]